MKLYICELIIQVKFDLICVCLLHRYVWRDVSADRQHTKTFILDDEGHFLVAAAVGCGSESELKRAEALIEAGARVLVMYI